MLQDQWPQARRMFDETRQVFEAIGNSSGVAINQLNVALIDAMLGHKLDGTAVPQLAAESDPVSALKIVLLEEHFGEARAKAEALLRSADASDLDARCEVSLVLGLALARSGSGARGLEVCRQGVRTGPKRPVGPRRKPTRCWPRRRRRWPPAIAPRLPIKQAARGPCSNPPSGRVLWRACVLCCDRGTRTALAAARVPPRSAN